MKSLSLIVSMLVGIVQADEIKLPATINAKAGVAVRIAAESKADVSWVILDDRAFVIPADDLKDSRICWIIPASSGSSYELKVFAFSWDTNKLIRGQTTIVVEAKSPVPVNDLKKKLQDAYNLDASAQAAKEKQRINLIGLYQAMAEVAMTVATTDQLSDTLKATKEKMIDPAILVDLRKVIATEIVNVLGTESKPMDAALKQQVAATFQAIAATLLEVK